MNELLDLIGKTAIDILINEEVKHLNKMLNLQHEGGTEIIENLVKKGRSFSNECKYTILGNSEGLDLIISHKGMEDTTYRNIIDKPEMGLDLFNLFIKHYFSNENFETAIKKYQKKEKKHYKVIFYPDKKLYNQAKQ